MGKRNAKSILLSPFLRGIVATGAGLLSYMAIYIWNQTIQRIENLEGFKVELERARLPTLETRVSINEERLRRLDK